MMIIICILSMTAIVFLSRYLFLEPKIPLRLNYHIERLLSYSGPVILTALWVPIVFFPENEFSFRLNNPYLIGAIVTGLLIWKTNNVLLATAISVGIFLLFNLVIFAS